MGAAGFFCTGMWCLTAGGAAAFAVAAAAGADTDGESLPPRALVQKVEVNVPVVSDEVGQTGVYKRGNTVRFQFIEAVR